MRPESGDRSPLSCSHPERLSDWSEVSAASGLKSLSCSHPVRLSDWSEVSFASGRKSPLSCPHLERLSAWSDLSAEACQRGEVAAELPAFGEVEGLERGEASGKRVRFSSCWRCNSVAPVLSASWMRRSAS